MDLTSFTILAAATQPMRKSDLAYEALKLLGNKAPTLSEQRQILTIIDNLVYLRDLDNRDGPYELTRRGRESLRDMTKRMRKLMRKLQVTGDSV